MKDIIKLEKRELEKKEKELKVELIRAKVDSQKKGGSKIKEIKKIIARINTFKNTQKNKPKETKK